MRPAASGGNHPPDRALVLHGGGSAGNAWEIGVVAGLLDAGVDVSDADVIIGTSAGATAAAQITAASPAALLEAILAAPPPRRPTTPAPAPPRIDHLARTNRIIATAHDAADMRRWISAAALELDAASDGSDSARWRAVTASRLPEHRWPDRTVLIPAIDARSAEPVVFDRFSGVDLVDAVAASTSSGTPYRLGEDRYLDGGYRRNENADLASGARRVLILSPFGGRSRHPLQWGMQLAAQVEELRAVGSEVLTVLPDDASVAAFGDDMMDLAARPPAARAGFAQGRALAPGLAAFWRAEAGGDGLPD